MRLRAVFVSFVLMTSASASIAASPPKAGATCSKSGIVKIYQGNKFTCLKNGKKLVWSKGVAVKETNPTPTSAPIPTQTPTPTSNPSSTVTPSTSPTPTSTGSSSRVGNKCNTPLVRESNFICWQVAQIGDEWTWVNFSPNLHTPYALPESVTWRKIAAPKLGGAENQLKYSNDILDKLATELNYYWIEVDIEGGKTITAAVWSPKIGSNYPVLIHFHGTGGLMFQDVEFAAQLAKKGYLLVVPVWWGPRSQFVERNAPRSSIALFENPNGPRFIGANLETSRMLLPVLKAASIQSQANASSLGVLGHSRGGTVALNLAATTPVIKVAIPLAAPFLPPQIQAPFQNPNEPGWETIPKSLVNQVNAKVLVVGAKKDVVVPPYSTQDYIEAARSAGKNNIEYIWLDASHQLIHDYNPTEQKLTLDTITKFLIENLK